MWLEEYVRLERCMVCHQDIHIGEKRVLIYRDEGGRYWVHAGECLENYKRLLTDLKEIEQGLILGMCDLCTKPVRSKQSYTVNRSGCKLSDLGKEGSCYTTFPASENNPPLNFRHKKCIELEIESLYRSKYE